MSGDSAVLHLLDPGPVGGRETVVQALAAAQRRAGLNVSVAAILEPGESGEAFCAPLESEGVPVMRIVLPPRRYLLERARVARLVRELGSSLVHMHGYRPDVVDAGVVRRLGVPIVTTVHGFTGGSFRNRLYERLQRRAFRRMDAVVAVSRALAERLVRSRTLRNRLYTIPNAWRQVVPPLDPARARALLGVNGSEFHIGWVGRLSDEKGPDIFLDALAFLRDIPLRASIVGEGREGPALAARAKVLRLSDRVLWHGTIPQASRLFTGFDVFVLSSRTEGTPMVLFEAAAAGVPIIAAAVGGVPDMLSADEGVLVAPSDVHALAEAIRCVYSEPRSARERAKMALRRLHDEYSAERWVARYLAVYDDVVTERPGRART